MPKKKRQKPLDSPESVTLSGIYSPTRKALILKSPSTLSVGNRLRRERFLRKLTLDQMASYLNISPSYLGAMERGKRPVSRKMMNLLHEKLDLSYDFMLEGLSLSGSMISQYVRESAPYTTHHNLNVLLQVCSPEELESCYQLIHTFLIHRRDKRIDEL